MATVRLTLPLAIAAQAPILVKTFPNPTPDGGEYFGWAMAPLGNDRVVVGTPYVILDFYTYSVGETYLFSTKDASRFSTNAVFRHGELKPLLHEDFCVWKMIRRTSGELKQAEYRLGLHLHYTGGEGRNRTDA